MNSVVTRGSGLNGINAILGIWMILSPFVLGSAGSYTIEWNNIAGGLAVLVVALTGGSGLNIALGAWLIISPWVLGFASASTLLWNNIILGALIGIVALIGNSASPRA